MNFIHFLLCITKNPITIKNINLPVCANCRHFIGYKYNPNENLENGFAQSAHVKAKNSLKWRGSLTIILSLHYWIFWNFL